MAIPKVIHYCWFGGNPKPALAEKCMKSWKKYCPDYEIIEWNEINFDITQNQYCKEAYEAKKWAFVTDYARLVILHQHGGFYFDTDVELLKSIDPLTDEHCFMGIEKSDRVIQCNTGLGIGAEAGHPLIKEMLDDYAGVSFYDAEGNEDITTCTVRNTRILKKHGYVEEDRTQNLENATVFASEYFSPMHMESGILKKTKNTYSIHHYSLSWTTEERRKEREQYLKRQKKANFIYNVKVLPNNIAKKMLGDEKYEKLKETLGKK